MTRLKRAWSEIRRGENIDLYVTVGVALILVFLTIVPLPIEGWVTSLTVAVLALLAVSMVGTRYKLDDILARTAAAEGVTFWENFPPKLQQDIASASDLWLVGVTLMQRTREHLLDIEAVLRKGGTVHVLVCEPNHPVLQYADKRSYVSTGVKSVSDDIAQTLTYFSRFQAQFPSRVEIRTIEYPLDHQIIGVNPGAASGVIYVANYSFRTPGGSKPKFAIDSRQPVWYDFYREELSLLFAGGKEWSSEATSTAGS